MKATTKGKIMKVGGISLDVAAPLIATLTQFPVFVQKGSGATMSGLFVVFAFLSCLPFARHIIKYMKSPAIWVFWAIAFAAFVVVRNIIDQMIIVAFVGLIANLIGTGVYKVGEKYDPKPLVVKIDEGKKE